MLPGHTANEKRWGADGISLRGSPTVLRYRANIICQFFLDVGRFLVVIRVSIEFHMVSYCSTIKSNFIISIM